MLRVTRRFVFAPLKWAARAALRAVAGGVVFFACCVAALWWLGYPVPGVSELEQYMESIVALSKILS